MSAPDLVAHLSPAELGQRYRAARSPVERSHLQIVWLLSRGRGEREVAQVTGYGRRWVAEVVRRYNEEGPGGLGDRRRGNAGAGPLLGAADEAALRAALAAPPADGGLWTGPEVAAWMGVRLGREVWPQRGWDYLRKLGYSAQVPRPSAARCSSLSRSTRCSSTSKSASRIAHLAGITLPAVCLPTTDAKRAYRAEPGVGRPRSARARVRRTAWWCRMSPWLPLGGAAEGRHVALQKP